MSSYFKHVPNFQYVNRNPQENTPLGDYIDVKNLFKRTKLLDDIFSDLNYFEKYSIIGDERPDQVAEKFYSDSNLDWIILISNNITNVQSEWPLPQLAFNRYLLNKYGSYEKLNEVHHYESREITTSNGVILVPRGLHIPIDYQIEYYDFITGQSRLVTNIAVPITNYQYEERLDNNKRNIFLLKSKYIAIVLDDMERIMPYKKGSTQYVSATLKKGDNIKIYE
jgi:hypothetical protein